MMDGCSDIGARNAAFAREFFAFEGIRVVKESLGGTTARRIQFWPATGQARLRLVVDHSAVRAVQAQSRRPVPQRQAEIELF
jgi:chemotaxis protein CheD